MFKYEVSAESLEGLKQLILNAAKQFEKSECKVCSDTGEMVEDIMRQVKESEEVIRTSEPVTPVELPSLPFSFAPPTTIDEAIGFIPPTTPVVEVKLGEVDKYGTPWDANIHSANKTFTADGSWRTRRNIDKAAVAAVVTKVKKEVESKYSPVDIPVDTRAHHTVESFAKNINLILSSLINEGKITRDYIKTLCDHFQVNHIWEITKDPQKCSSLFDYFVSEGLIGKASL